MSRVFSEGEVIVRREILDGREWMAYPVQVAADDGVTLATYLHQGTQLAFGGGDFRWGIHPWAAFEPYWQSDGVLQLQRAGDGYSVWARRSGDAFDGWYVNFQEPLRRTEAGYDTLDQELDLWIPGDGSPYRWKDVADFEERARSGGFTAEEAASVRAAAREVEALIASGDCWWEKWRDWSKPAGWDVPAPVAVGEARAATAHG
ncbi:hypothetical protein Stsp01_16370 [Streptomyces sp. NBRC 13847]|uniref:DUF402 domain-containing protein n=1 Tax=Streptomyces TaxID=1883 RepID=UPI0024A361E5|nr:DUF402 domain-containing protein [Streptomyces sp. NBRC 13847]GLW14894.1 hypothetical protein Stsp01_16370 [Streptomyces sp. NBRC 13847]